MISLKYNELLDETTLTLFSVNLFYTIMRNHLLIGWFDDLCSSQLSSSLTCSAVKCFMDEQ